MASNNTELKIDDDYINSQAEQIAKWACDLQGGIDKYFGSCYYGRCDCRSIRELC